MGNIFEREVEFSVEGRKGYESEIILIKVYLR